MSTLSASTRRAAAVLAVIAAGLVVPEIAQAADQTLRVTVTGGPGLVTSSPAGIDCASTCSASFAEGTTVTLTARPAAGYSFGDIPSVQGGRRGPGWRDGACAIPDGHPEICRLTITTSGQSATAVFRPAAELLVIANGRGQVRATMDGTPAVGELADRTCRDLECPYLYLPTRTITLRATADRPGLGAPAIAPAFGSWSDDRCRVQGPLLGCQGR